MNGASEHDTVGPVLIAGELATAMIAAIRECNDGVEIADRGAYVRVLVPGACRLTRAAVEALTGEPFSIPADLEKVMPSFKGRFEASEEEVSWQFERSAPR